MLVRDEIGSALASCLKQIALPILENFVASNGLLWRLTMGRHNCLSATCRDWGLLFLTSARTDSALALDFSVVMAGRRPPD